MELPHITETRAHWQRTEGMVIFDHAFRQIFPQILDRVDPEGIARCQRMQPNMNGLQLALVASRHIAAETAYVTPRYTETDVNNLHDNMGLFTHSGIRFALNEGVDSTVFFPLNLLAAADLQTPPGTVSLTKRLCDVSTTLRRPFFGKLVETAAFTSNGFWRRFASAEYSGEQIDKFLGQKPHFNFYDSPHGIEFDFTDGVKQALLSSLRKRNKEARNRSGIFKNVPESTAMGTTSGCPVARKAPQFTDTPYDKDRVQRLSTYYHMAPEDLTYPRPESSIVFGLRRFGELLERVEDAL